MPTPEGTEFSGTSRFTIVRRLGTGGMGVVYEAHDTRHDTRVALKTLTRMDAEAIYQLKVEFRVIAGVTHPNLVTLYELHAENGVWFITMELVRGLSFREYLGAPTAEAAEAPTHTEMSIDRGPVLPLEDHASATETEPSARLRAPACDVVRLRGALCQLVEGVRAIHAAGKLHRDLKPQNVLVTNTGRVVILDFGIAADLPGIARDLELTSRPYAGTPRYMSPEQFTPNDLNEGADWYAVGVMLFEALTGHLPFRGSSVGELAREKAARDPLPPSAFVDGVPEDIDRLCAEMLRSRASARPSGAAIAARLAPTDQLVRPPVAEAAVRSLPRLVGRDVTLADLRHARAAVGTSGPVVAFLQGRSGMGKSAVLEAFLDECERDDHPVVLSGRCYEAESVPFKALDVLMDSLARHLRRQSPTELAALLPRRADVLARMFPTLLRVPAFADAPRGRSAAKDAVEERQIASAALAELIGRLTDRAPLVIAIDDMQWGDLDSATLIGDLLGPPDAPPFLLVMAAREEQADTNACLKYLRQQASRVAVVDIALPPLSGSDVAALHARVRADAPPLSIERATRIAADAMGNPFIIREVLEADDEAEAGQEAVAAMIREKVSRLEPDSRRLVEIVALSVKRLPATIACEAAGIAGDTQRVIARLRGMRLLRTEGADDRDSLETYHDRIRETVANELDTDRRLDGHKRLAEALGRQHPADAEHLAHHLEGAGRLSEAAILFGRAAEQASQALAFGHAVMLYERALGLSERREATLIGRLAEALAEAGRSAEAADRFVEAGRLTDGETRREYVRRAAYYFCISGRIDEGKAALGDVLGHFDITLPRGRGAAIASVLAARARLWFRGTRFDPRPPEALAAPVREEVDSLWAAAIGLGNTEVISGIGFSTRGLLKALDAGDPARIVRAMCWEACLRAVDDVASAAKLIDRAETILRTCESAYLRGMVLLARAIHAINVTRFRDSIPLFDEAEALWLEHGHGVDWEVNTARHFCSWSLLYSGEYAEAGRRMAAQQRLAAERGNRYVMVSMGVYAEPLGMLAAGHAAEARQRRADVLALWTDGHFNVQHIIALLGDIQSALYERDGPLALEAAKRQHAAAHEHGFDRLALGRITTDSLMLNSAFLTLQASGVKGDVPPEALRAVRRLEKEKPAWGPAAAEAGRAGLALDQGDQNAAVRHLEMAERAFTEIGMTGLASAARRNLGLLVGGDRGVDLVHDADVWLTAHGVRDPARFLPVLMHLPIRGARP